MLWCSDVEVVTFCFVFVFLLCCQCVAGRDNRLTFTVDDVEQEAQFLCVRPWHGAIRAPSEPPTVTNSPPGVDLELEWVHGYHSSSRNNVFRLASGEIVYHTATLGVVFNREEHTQRQYFGHEGEILCLARHPEGSIVATGEMGRKPRVHVRGGSLCWTGASVLGLAWLGLVCGCFFQNHVLVLWW